MTSMERKIHRAQRLRFAGSQNIKCLQCCRKFIRTKRNPADAGSRVSNVQGGLAASAKPDKPDCPAPYRGQIKHAPLARLPYFC